ncbi:MAG: SPOR domain-containing protein [Leptolyngbyaceae cyanobacterium RM2_2_4]|nr:SPOR domain-containing protein [Leptolyngbyaceae cyanobacterium RM2_2_4]
MLKSLDDDAEIPPSEPGFVQSLLTPLGIGSMLLLLLSSVTLGYLIMNPASLGIFSEGESQGDRNSNSGEVATRPDSTDLPSNVLPGSPDLATEEFRELNLDTLGTLPTGEVSAPLPVTGTVNSGATPTPTAAAASSLPAPLANSQSTSNLPTTAVPATVSMRPNGRSAPAQAAPAAPRPATAARPSAPARPSPAARSSAPAQANTATAARPPAVQAQPASPPVAAAPAPAANPAPSQSQDGYFYVTTPYNGDRSLEQARQAVGDAYVRNFPEGGAQVQVGAFRDRAGAEDLANELEQQGISAEVHQP